MRPNDERMKLSISHEKCAEEEKEKRTREIFIDNAAPGFQGFGNGKELIHSRSGPHGSTSLLCRQSTTFFRAD